MNSYNEHRRRFLAQSLAMLAIGGFSTRAYSESQSLLQEGKSIYQVNGDLLVDGKSADQDTKIIANSELQTGPDSQAIFVVGDDAFYLRENSRLKLSGNDNILIQGLRLINGALLSVFAERKERSHMIKTPQAHLGIRGTGIYVEHDQDRTYACTCYGTVDVYSAYDKNVGERIVSQNHDAPRYIWKEGDKAKVEAAPVINHSNIELMLLEELVGRVAPFPISGGSSYSRSRKRLY